MNRRAVVADRVFTLSAWIFGGLGLALPFSIVGFILVNGAHVISWQFLTEDPAGFPLGMAGGILPAIKGSLALVGIGVVIALPTAVGGAIYLTEYGKNVFVLRSVRFITECLAANPAIIYGLCGYSLLVVFMALKISLLAGAITLGLMMFPIILIGSQEAIQAVESEYREAALSLGVTKAYVVRWIILRKALPGILAATVLATGHALGSAAPILFTASTVFSHGGMSLDAPVMTLPTHLYYLVNQALSFDHAYGTALVLVVLLFMINFLAWTLKRYVGR